MPLTKKGRKILGSMTKEYGAKKAKQVLYASKNAGKISGIDRGFYGHMNPEHAPQGEPVGHYGIGCEMR